MSYQLKKHKFVPTPIAQSIRVALGVTAVFGMSHAAMAQEEPTKVTRIEITGSSIKRLDAETALPIQIVTRDAIEKSGVTTAEQLMAQLSANVGAIEEKAQNTDQQENSGFSGANLRGIGVSSTLVLMNGRRMANYAFGGQGVDLSSIPVSALERVEILKDGASATYGADAVGGVINFITRKDYQGAEIGVKGGGYEAGGGNRKQLTASVGYGDIENDRFNVFGSVQIQKSAQLRAVQREWSKTSFRPDVGSSGTSSTNFPANIFASPTSGTVLGSVTTNGGKCNPPLSLFVNGMCQFDYQPFADLVPESKKLNAFSRGVFKLDENNQLFAEVAYSKNDANYRISPALFRNYRLTTNGPLIGLSYPAGGAFYPKSYISPTTGLPMATSGKALGVRVRLLPLGQRERVQESTQERLVVGSEGQIIGWDYNTAFNHSVSKSLEQYNNGFVFGSKLGSLIASGVVNLWGDNTPDVMAQLEATQAHKAIGRIGKATSDSVDGHASKEIFQLPAGGLAMALGFELRREKLDDSQGVEAKTNLINNVTHSPDTNAQRDVKALFSEVHVPLVKNLDMDFAIRYDSYSGNIGSSTNPKLSLRWQPIKALVLRAAAGTGFRAPTLADVNSGDISGGTNALYSDPLRCINNKGPGCTPVSINTRSSGNPLLTPETSRQFSLGAAFEAGYGISATVDYWNIEKKDVISKLSEGLISSNYAAIAGNVNRGPADALNPTLPGEIIDIWLPMYNQGAANVAGIDLALQHRQSLSEFGKLKTSLSGTYLTKSEEQLLKGGVFTNNLGVYANLHPTPRWKHRLSFDWSLDAWGMTLSNNFQSRYRDAFAQGPTNATTGFVTSVAHGTPGSVSKNVASYSTFDLQTGYSGFKNIRLNFGVINLANKAPNISNQALYFRGFDQSVDATGRYVYASLNYAYK